MPSSDNADERSFRRQAASLTSDQPLWAVVMLTLADVLDRPRIAVTVWSVLAVRAVLNARRHRPPGPPRSSASGPKDPEDVPPGPGSVSGPDTRHHPSLS